MRRLFISLLALVSTLGIQAQEMILLSNGDGLSSSLVNCIFNDSRGDVWIGTENGLNRYDGLRIKKYMHDSDDSHSLSHNVVRTIAEDRNGRLIIGGQKGIQIYDPLTDSFSLPLKLESGDDYLQNVNNILIKDDGEVWITGQKLLKLVVDGTGTSYLRETGLEEFRTNSSSSIAEAPDGAVWVSSYGGKVFRISNDLIVRQYEVSGQNGPSHRIFCSSSGLVLISDDRGNLAYYDEGTDTFIEVRSTELNSALILCFCELTDGSILMGTDGNGSYIMDEDTKAVSFLDFNGCPFPSSSLKVHAAVEDNYGNLWLGLYLKGVLMIPSIQSDFSYRAVNAMMSNTEESSCVTSIAYDSHGGLWIGTDNDGLYSLSEPDGEFTHLLSSDGSVPRTIFSLVEASDGFIWFGSYLNGLWRLDANSGIATNSSAITGYGNETHSVYSIKEDSRGRLWIATMGSGLYYLDLNSNRVVVPENQGGLNRWITDIEISDDTIYASSFSGLYKIDLEADSFKSVENILPGCIVYAVAKDDDYIYAGTIDGLTILNRLDEPVRTLTTEYGLPDNKIADIVVSDAGDVWISTANGLFSMDKKNFSISNYAGRGVRVNEFSSNTSAVSPDGTIAFGGVGGMVVVNPELCTGPEHVWTPKIVSFEVPERFIPVTGDLTFTLEHNENSFTVGFTTKEFNAPNKLSYMYSINGMPWVSLPAGQNSLALGNLTRHNYSLDIKVVDNHIVSQPAHLTVRIKRAWWASIVAVVFYFFAASAALAGVALLLRRRRNDKKEIEKQRENAEANEERVKFLIDLSHEIRSPMTLILSPLKSLISDDKDAGRQSLYSIMERNIDRVLSIVNQVLDIRKIEKGQMHLSFVPVRIADYVKAICSMFSFSLERRGQKLSFHNNGAEQTELWIDPDQFDKIIVNLITNAIKYTPEGGSIDVIVEAGDEDVSIEVMDDGIGMTELEQKKVFERFYQTDSKNSGTGLGLNIARSLTELHRGTLSVSSNRAGKGTVFTVVLPLGCAHLLNDEINAGNRTLCSREMTSINDQAPSLPQSNNISSSRKTIVIVDDDEEVRQYIATELTPLYKVIACPNGKDAFSRILTSSPDLVVSDVVMPEMDGYALCKKLRREHKVCHIPIILLTARSEEEEQIKGLEIGADAYIIKPFTINLLKTTIAGLLSNRDKLKVSFAESMVKPEKIKNVELKTPDEKLVERLVRVINNNLDNPELSVQTLSFEAGISRTHLHRKLKEITNQTASDFIRNIRLEKAAEMLSLKNYSIAELSDAVGFSNPSTFATAFKAHFGVSPSEYKKKTTG